MKDIVFNLPEYMADYEECQVHVFSDLHIGDGHCNYKSITQRIDEVKDTPNAFILLNGDLMNNALKDSVSDCYGEHFSPLGQVERICELFAPVKDKIIAVTSGNHENRTAKATGIDVARMYCLEMGIQERYTKEGALIFLYGGKESRGHKETGNPSKVRGISYVIYMTHGCGGSRAVGGKMNRLESLSGICDADIYVMGHTHAPATFKEGYMRVDPRNHTHQNVTKMFVNTAASLDYGGYGEQFGFKPSSIDNPVIHLGMHKKWFRTTL